MNKYLPSGFSKFAKKPIERQEKREYEFLKSKYNQIIEVLHFYASYDEERPGASLSELEDDKGYRAYFLLEELGEIDAEDN